MPEETENLSPIKRCYRKIRFSGLILETNKPWSLILSIYHMIMLNYVGFGAVLDMLLREKNLIDFVQAISTVMIYVHNTAKAVNIYTHQKEVKQLLDRLDKFSMEISQDEMIANQYETRQLSLRVKFISVYTMSFLWLAPFSFITGVTGDYMTGFVKPHIPLQVWLPWNMKGVWSYMAGMVFVTLLEFSVCIYYMSGLIVLFTFTNELSKCLQILQKRLETRGPADQTVYEYHKMMIQEWLKSQIHFLKSIMALQSTMTFFWLGVNVFGLIIEYVNKTQLRFGPQFWATCGILFIFREIYFRFILLQDFNKLFSGPYYVEILATTLQPCGFGYTFIKLLKRYDPSASEVIIKCLFSVLAPSIVCACGQQISTQMEKLHTSAYKSKWYEEKPKIRKNLVILLTLTTKRIDLNYKKFISYNYACLATVLQGIYTYLMMIFNFDSD